MNKNFKNYAYMSFAMALAMTMTGCSDDDNKVEITETDVAYVGKDVGNFTADEWYPGGKLGTTENTGSSCYSDETPAVDNDADLKSQFFIGEQMFERQYTLNTGAFKGLGPASVRTSCFDCHPEYGHGKRKTQYETRYGNGNGYLLVIYHPKADSPNDGSYISEVTGMPQTQAQSPFLPPVDESKINLAWEHVNKMETDEIPSMQFPDGEKFDLIYPEITIPQDAFNTLPKPTDYAVRLESTIGIGGTGLIDAIPTEDIVAQYKSEAAYFKSAGLNVSEYINPSMFDANTMEMAASAYYTTFGRDGLYTTGGVHADGTTFDPNTTDGNKKLIKRYTYALTRGSLQDGPGANAMWNITNVTRTDRPVLYTTKAWADCMAQTPSVIAAIKKDPTSPYYADGTDDGIKNAVSTLLNPKTNQFDNAIHNFQPEQSMDDFYAFMVWHRGLAVPRARNLNDPDVQKGKKLFMEWGCTNCHKPSWKTGDDNYVTSKYIADKKLPRYQNQTIYPYSDFVQHKLYMKNDIHGSWCRTTPLWGRGLSYINTGAEDRLHDCRARNEIEAIMWHCYSKKSHAYSSAMHFYKASKADRDAVVKFLRSI
ncbi:MAG TPA: hypothetical protein DEQ17_04925 [Prevotella sp.]|nr:hypothetical protein [Prevotella sp.]